MELAKIIGLRLKAVRLAITDKNGLNIAQDLQIAPSTYSQHETGKRMLSLDALLRYCEYYQISSEWLLTGKATITEPYCKQKEEKIKKQLFILNIEDNAKLLAINQLGCNTVDLNLLFNIFSQLVFKFSSIDKYLSSKELTNYCLDIYNNLINLEINDAQQQSMIALSIDSLNAGLKKAQEQLEKIS